MHLLLEIAAILLVLLNYVITKKGLNEGLFFQKCSLHPTAMSQIRQFPRLITAGFMHDSWVHLSFLMFSLLLFAFGFGDHIPLYMFSLAYFLGILGGNILSIWSGQSHASYQTFGASGGISGLIFACLLVQPDLHIPFFFFPVSFPAWVYGAVLFVYSLFGFAGSRRPKYEMHIGGAIGGLVSIMILVPELWVNQPVLMLGSVSLISLIICIYATHKHQAYAPFTREVVLVHTSKHAKQYVEEVVIDRETELNALLDEITQKGITDLSPAQRQRLDELASDL